MSCEPANPTVNKVTDLFKSLHIFASTELSTPPEKATATELSPPMTAFNSFRMTSSNGVDSFNIANEGVGLFDVDFILVLQCIS
jgi:hypothetical protein